MATLLQSRLHRVYLAARPQLVEKAVPFDVVIVGGGIVGLATARELALRHRGLRLAVVEKERELALHQTGHNSGVIHAGIYYKPGSLKARLCVKGVDMIYHYCDTHGVPYRKCGKLIVAVEEEEVSRLMELWRRGQANGVQGLRLLDGDQIREIEPHCRGRMAIHSPNTGIVDYRSVALSLAEDFRKSGGTIVTEFEVSDLSMDSNSESGLVQVSAKSKSPILSRYVITCGGLYSDHLAKLSGCKAGLRVVPFRGEYLVLKPDKCNMVKGNIYPVPNPAFPFLGVHFTPRMDGSVWLGPNAVLAFAREGYKWTDVNVGELREALSYGGLWKLIGKYWRYGMGEIYRSIAIGRQVKRLQRFVPDLQLSDVERGPAGVRAMAMDAEGHLVEDIVFDRGTGLLGRRMLHVCNAPSPAATSSLAIAEMVADKAETLFALHSSK